MVNHPVLKWLMLVFLLCVTACSQGGEDPGAASFDNESRLQRFEDCESVQAYIAETSGVEKDLEARYSEQLVTAGDVAVNAPEAGGEPSGGEREFTSTNVQENGVDEPDFVKTDGDFIYMVTGGQYLLFKGWPAAEAEELYRYEIEGAPLSLFVHNDVVMIFSTLWNVSAVEPDFAPKNLYLLKITLLKNRPGPSPELLRELYIEGRFLDARMVEGRVHLATLAGLPGVAKEQSGLADIFPRYYDKTFGGSEQSVTQDSVCACENLYRPTIPNGTDILSLLTIDLNRPQDKPKSISVMSSGGQIYGAEKSLYVAARNQDFWPWWPVASGESEAPQITTTIHRFDLGAEPSYACSGQVEGWVLDQFSMSEHQGTLRIATTDDDWGRSGNTENRLFLLQQQQTKLQEIGRLEGLGKPGESIYAVRFLGERGYVVTFRQTDPLYSLDLSDPASPQVAGELEVPGFSTYLHPLGESHLLAVGRNVDRGGVDLSIFDVSDPGLPQLAARESLGARSYSEAEYEHKAFSYFASRGVLALPVSLKEKNAEGQTELFSGLQIYDVDTTSGFSLRGRINHAEFSFNGSERPWYYPEPVRRSFFIGEPGAGDFIYTVSRRGLKASLLDDPSNDVAALELPAEQVYWLEAPIGTVLPAAP